MLPVFHWLDVIEKKLNLKYLKRPKTNFPYEFTESECFSNRKSHTLERDFLKYYQGIGKICKFLLKQDTII